MNIRGISGFHRFIRWRTILRHHWSLYKQNQKQTTHEIENKNRFLLKCQKIESRLQHTIHHQIKITASWRWPCSRTVWAVSWSPIPWKEYRTGAGCRCTWGSRGCSPCRTCLRRWMPRGRWGRCPRRWPPCRTRLPRWTWCCCTCAGCRWKGKMEI